MSTDRVIDQGAAEFDPTVERMGAERQAGRPGPPQTFIDAGDVPWTELRPLLAGQMAELWSGEMLEVQSGDPATIMALPGWCAGEGHSLLHAQPGDGRISFWIGKNP